MSAWERVDPGTREHFDAWCERENIGQAMQRGMRQEFLRDPERYERAGWWACYDAAQDARAEAMDE